MRITIELNPLEETEYDRLGGELWLREVLLQSALGHESHRTSGESDVVRGWVAAECDLRPEARVSATDAWRAFEAWRVDTLSGPVSRIRLSKCLRTLFHPRVDAIRTAQGVVYHGLGLRAAAAGAKVATSDPDRI